jgi:hypothetical protein
MASSSLTTAARGIDTRGMVSSTRMQSTFNLHPENPLRQVEVSLLHPSTRADRKSDCVCIDCVICSSHDPHSLSTTRGRSTDAVSLEWEAASAVSDHHLVPAVASSCGGSSLALAMVSRGKSCDSSGGVAAIGPSPQPSPAGEGASSSPCGGSRAGHGLSWQVNRFERRCCGNRPLTAARPRLNFAERTSYRKIMNSYGIL